jgi:hypothetical protein
MIAEAFDHPRRMAGSSNYHRLNPHIARNLYPSFVRRQRGQAQVPCRRQTGAVTDHAMATNLQICLSRTAQTACPAASQI